MVNLSFLTERSPIVIPHGILPESFVPQDGGVYDSFAPGLPPVISLNGQFYPLTNEELQYLKQQFSAPGNNSSAKPEAMPQMPQQPQMPDQVSENRIFEQSVEKVQELQKEQQNIQSPVSPTPVPASTSSPTPQVLVKVEEVLSFGRDLVSQSTLDSHYKSYRKGQLKPKANAGDDAVEWLRWLLLKAFQEQDKD